MIAFIVGALVGASAAIAILGFLAAVAEDLEKQEEARRRKAEDKRQMDELMDHYRSYY